LTSKLPERVHRGVTVRYCLLIWGHPRHRRVVVRRDVGDISPMDVSSRLVSSFAS
jgi:hypothetical protein